jgi:homoserine O-acetyltransferase
MRSRPWVATSSDERSAEPDSVILPPLPLDGGGTLDSPRVAFHAHGALDAQRGNVVLVLHALTGSTQAAHEWWSGLIGPGAAIDTDRHAVLVPNLLGSCYGSSGPREGGEPFPPLTTRDQARAIGVLLQRLEIPRVELVVGGSLGGMVALEVAASFPGLVAQALVIAAPAQQTTWGLGWNALQRALVRDRGAEGLELARATAMLTYRGAEGLERRFGRQRDANGEHEIARWLRGHGVRFRERFDAASYLALLAAMDAHDVARSEGGVATRLRASGTRFTGVGIPGDVLYPPNVVESWVRATGGSYAEIHSEHGHDAFLIEKAQVASLLRSALGDAAFARSA